MSNTLPTALVTGASQGIGTHIAQTLLQNGYRVFGTSRSGQAQSNGIEMLQLDLRDPQSILECVERVEEQAGSLDLLVSNAGMTIVAPAEELPLEKAQEMMDTNFFGVARLVNALLPGMRDKRAGRLIFISSLAGRMGIPGQGYYCSTKHALEGYVDGLRAELAGFGIDTTLLEPGSHRTDIIVKSPKPDWPTFDAYDDMRDKLRSGAEEANREGADPQQVANVVLRAAKANTPKIRYRINGEGKQAMFFKSILPEAMFYRILGKRFGF